MNAACPTVRPWPACAPIGCQQNVSDSEQHQGPCWRIWASASPSSPKRTRISSCSTLAPSGSMPRIGCFGNIGAPQGRSNAAKPGCAHYRRVRLHGAAGARRRKSSGESYPFVGLVFGTHVIHTSARIAVPGRCGSRPAGAVLDRGDDSMDERHCRGAFRVGGIGSIQGLPDRLWYGCNNFCYLLRRAARSAAGSAAGILPVRHRGGVPGTAWRQGYTEIALLGQNVNSYGEGEAHGAAAFPSVLTAPLGRHRGRPPHPLHDLAPQRRDPRIAGQPWRRAASSLSQHLHLPFQAGNDRDPASAMNRGYTREQLFGAGGCMRRKKMPGHCLDERTSSWAFPAKRMRNFRIRFRSCARWASFRAVYLHLYSPARGHPRRLHADPVPGRGEVPPGSRNCWRPSRKRWPAGTAGRHRGQCPCAVPWSRNATESDGLPGGAPAEGISSTVVDAGDRPVGGTAMPSVRHHRVATSWVLKGRLGSGNAYNDNNLFRRMILHGRYDWHWPANWARHPPAGRAVYPAPQMAQAATADDDEDAAGAASGNSTSSASPSATRPTKEDTRRGQAADPRRRSSARAVRPHHAPIAQHGRLQPGQGPRWTWSLKRHRRHHHPVRSKGSQETADLTEDACGGSCAGCSGGN